MIKLIVMAAIVVMGLMYFDIIDLGPANDSVKDMVNEQVDKGKDSLEGYKDDALDKLKEGGK